MILESRRRLVLSKPPPDLHHVLGQYLLAHVQFGVCSVMMVGAMTARRGSVLPWMPSGANLEYVVTRLFENRALVARARS
jgi:hypothetical protein